MHEVIEGRRWRTLTEEIIDKERDSMGGLGPFERRWVLDRPWVPERLRRALELVQEGKAEVSRRSEVSVWENTHNRFVPSKWGEYVFTPLIGGAANSPFASVVGQPSANPSSFTAINTTNSETNLWVPAIWTPIPANDMQAGKVYEHKSGGIFSTSSAAPTSTWTPRIGQSATPASNITMGASTATTMIASLSSVPFFSQFTFTIRTLGLAASGAGATGNGFVVIGGITSAAGIVQSIGATVASTVDNTAATGYVLSQTWGTNAAANSLQCQWVTPVYSYN